MANKIKLKLFLLVITSMLAASFIGYLLANYSTTKISTFVLTLFFSIAMISLGIHHIYTSIKNHEYWFEQILDKLPTPLSVTDREMNWTYINTPVEKLFKKPKKTFIGKHCSHWGAGICNTENCGITQLKKGNTETFFSQFGRDFRVDTHYLYNTSGEKAGHVEVCTDITAILEVSRAAEREKAQKIKLKQSIAELKATQYKLIQAEKLASLGKMVADIAHEVNTPLGICITAASTLKEHSEEFYEKTNAKQVNLHSLESFIKKNIEISELIYHPLDRVINLVSNFKQIAIDTTNNKSEEFNLKSHLLLYLKTIKSELTKNNAEVSVIIPKAILLSSYPSAFELIYYNLITNSLTHCGIDGTKKITINAYQKNSDIYIEYKDNGIGIDEKLQARIFDPFVSSKKADGNTGLGLHIIYNLIVQGLQGEIDYVANKKRGACFLIKIPTQANFSNKSKPYDNNSNALKIDTKVTFE